MTPAIILKSYSFALNAVFLIKKLSGQKSVVHGAKNTIVATWKLLNTQFNKNFNY